MILTIRELQLAGMTLGNHAQDVRDIVAEGKTGDPISDAAYADELQALSTRFEEELTFRRAGL